MRRLQLRPQSAAGLEAWLGTAVNGNRLNSCFVATDQHGRLLAGVSIQDDAQLMTVRVTRLPAVLRAVNLAARVVPADREMRNANASMLWFAPGQEPAARHLWQTVRWQWRDRATNLVSAIDPRSPGAQMVQTPRWLPTTSLAIAVRSPRPLDIAHFIDPPV